MLVALNKETIDRHLEELAPGGGIIYDEDKIPLNKEDLRREELGLARSAREI